MNVRFILNSFLFVFAGFLITTGCSKSDDQRAFENESLQAPSNFTRTTPQGEIVNEDPDDWRVSPMYRGLINIGIGLGSFEPPYPNPLDYNQELTLNIYLSSIDNLNRLEVYAFEFVSDAGQAPIIVRDDLSSNSALISFRVNGEEISGKSGSTQANGLYRIRILDGNQNVITYGDIKIGSS